jgi:hypothetical protein
VLFEVKPIPQATSLPNAASRSTISPACRHACSAETSGLVTIDRMLAAMNKMPPTPTLMAA